MELIIDRKELIKENSDINTLIEIFEQIDIYNEIGFQTIKIALISVLDKINDKKNYTPIINAIEQINKSMDHCRTASDKINHLSKSGSKIVLKLLNDINNFPQNNPE